MKKILLLIVIFMNTISSAHPGGDKNYVISDDETVIYQPESDATVLALGVAGAAILSIFPAFFYKLGGVDIFNPRKLKGAAFIPLCFASLPIASISAGVYHYISGKLNKNKILMRLNKEGFFYKDHGWISWDEVYTVAIVELIDGLRVQYRETGIVLKKENRDPILLSDAAFAVTTRKLLKLINRYKPVMVPTKKEIRTCIPWHYKTNPEKLHPKLKAIIKNGDLVTGNRLVGLPFCLRADEHECTSDRCYKLIKSKLIAPKV